MEQQQQQQQQTDTHVQSQQQPSTTNNNNNTFNYFDTQISLANMFDYSTKSKFKNKNYILKFSNQSNVKFFKDELTIKYSGKGYNLIDYATVQANCPINNKDPIFYFEIEIIDEGSKRDITIGFSDKEVVLNKQCGTISKSYGYNGDGKIYGGETKETFGPKFKKGDVIGCGFYFSKNAIFYTYNGKFIKYAFNNAEPATYYPTVSLHSLNECIKANFGRTNYTFDIEGFYISEMKVKIDKVLEIDTPLQELDYIVREYLIHSGYQETFNAIEFSNSECNGCQRETANNNVGNVKCSNTNTTTTSNNNVNNDGDNGNNYDELVATSDKMLIDTEDPKMRKYSSEEVPEVRKRTLSFVLDRMNESEKEKDKFKIITFLQERKIIQNMLIEKDYETAITFFTKEFKDYKTKNERNFMSILTCLTTMRYFTLLKQNDYQHAFELLNALDKAYWTETNVINLYDKHDKIIEVTVDKISTLLCYQKVEESEYAYFLVDKQLDFLANQINALILEMVGLSNESILEKIMKQQTMVSNIYSAIKNSPGETLSIIIN